MNKLLLTLLCIATLIGSYSCNKNNNAPDKPEIALISVEPTTVKNAFNFDTVKISLRYTIDAKQIGNESSDTKIILQDSRDTTEAPISLPQGIDVSSLDSKIVSGTITLILPASQFFILDDPQVADTIQYKIQLEDKDQIRSNTVTTPDIYIVP